MLVQCIGGILSACNMQNLTLLKNQVSIEYIAQ